MNKNNDVEKDMKKKPLSKKIKTKIIVILACIFLAYCVFLMVKLVNNPIETFIVEQGKIYKEESVTGYILRDEQIVQNEGNTRNYGSVKIRSKESCKRRSNI